MNSSKNLATRRLLFILQHQIGAKIFVLLMLVALGWWAVDPDSEIPVGLKQIQGTVSFDKIISKGRGGGVQYLLRIDEGGQSNQYRTALKIWTATDVQVYSGMQARGLWKFQKSIIPDEPTRLLYQLSMNEIGIFDESSAIAAIVRRNQGRGIMFLLMFGAFLALFLQSSYLAYVKHK